MLFKSSKPITGIMTTSDRRANFRMRIFVLCAFETGRSIYIDFPNLGKDRATKLNTLKFNGLLIIAV